MVVVFMKIEQVGSADPKVLAGGIYIALITTVAGLVIALPVTVAQEYIRTETNKILHGLDLYLIEIREWVERRKTAE
jgi:biopolymer transport protein ExbB